MSHTPKSSSDEQAVSRDASSANPEVVLDVVDPSDEQEFEFTVSEFKGPLPHPETLAAYDEVVPGLAREIIDAFKAESAHRRAIEVKQCDADISLRSNGQMCGLIISVAAIVASPIIAFANASGWNAAAGAALGCGSLATLVYVFMTGQKPESPRKSAGSGKTK